MQYVDSQQASSTVAAFNPNENQNNLCAFHLDGNRYNNRLGNLEWKSRSDVVPGHTRSSVPVLIFDESKSFEFGSSSQCADYLKSINIKAARHSVANWCRNRLKQHGLQFTYKDESRYNNFVESLPNEKWVRISENVIS